MSLAYVFFGILAILGIAVQIYLSKKPQFWFGLILPIIIFLLSVIFAGSVYMFSADAYVDVNAYALYILSMSNTYTLVLLVTLFVVRRMQKKKRDLKKMGIQDL